MAMLRLTLDSVFLLRGTGYARLSSSFLPSNQFLLFLPTRRYYRDREEASHEIFESALASLFLSISLCRLSARKLKVLATPPPPPHRRGTPSLHFISRDIEWVSSPLERCSHILEYRM